MLVGDGQGRPPAVSSVHCYNFLTTTHASLAEPHLSIHTQEKTWLHSLTYKAYAQQTKRATQRSLPKAMAHSDVEPQTQNDSGSETPNSKFSRNDYEDESESNERELESDLELEWMRT